MKKRQTVGKELVGEVTLEIHAIYLGKIANYS